MKKSFSFGVLLLFYTFKVFASPESELGKKLFFDPRLSRDGSISCNSCHNVMLGGDDNRPNSVGILGQKGGRSAPTVFNSDLQSVQFWDGRAASLEEQAKGPLTNPIEMGMPNHDAVMARIGSIPGYVEEFKKVFPKDKNPLTIDNYAKAVAEFERTLTLHNSPFDKFQKGNKKAISANAQKGWQLVQEVGCTSCHSGSNFSGPSLPQGVGFYQKFPVYPSELDKKYSFLKDQGRASVTKKKEDENLWRVPTWRNIAKTAPYFHNGSVSTLDEAVRVMAKTQLNKTLPESDVSAIVEFLESLNSELKDFKAPILPITSGKSIVSP